MAQPPDISETFVREVDENLRRDQMRDFAQKHGVWVVVAAILFLAAAGGFIYWQNWRGQQTQKQVEELSQTFNDIGAGKTGAASQQKLDALAKDSSKAVRATAMFARAAMALQQNDTKLATAKYREIASDDSLPKPFRDAALIRQTSLEFDSLKPEDVIGRLQPLAKKGEPWFGSAGELTAIALMKQGKTKEAGALFASIAADKQVPDEIRARSVQIASTLGVDASGAMPLPAQ
ncbi:MAG TPA: tetratricopeptide repeat protein [Sphingomicrobium sp.]